MTRRWLFETSRLHQKLGTLVLESCVGELHQRVFKRAERKKGKAYFSLSASQIFVFIVVVFLIIFSSRVSAFVFIVRQRFLATVLNTHSVPIDDWHKKQRVRSKWTVHKVCSCNLW